MALLTIKNMNNKIAKYCQDLILKFDDIPIDRKEILLKIATYIQAKKDNQEEIQLMYVCTHNSRRSHFGQIWAAVAAIYYGVSNVKTYSGGTEETAFHPNAIAALIRAGFEITTLEDGENPKYKVDFGENLSTICFSKTYDNDSNPSSNFAAIMTCSDAEENCPFIPGVQLRIATTYEDPKAYDRTNIEQVMYNQRCAQIALETLFVFSTIQ